MTHTRFRVELHRTISHAPSGHVVQRVHVAIDDCCVLVENVSGGHWTGARDALGQYPPAVQAMGSDTGVGQKKP
jgi:hypothetical protein